MFLTTCSRLPHDSHWGYYTCQTWGPQLQELWSISPALKVVNEQRVIPASGAWMNWEQHHDDDTRRRMHSQTRKLGDIIERKNLPPPGRDLCEPLDRGGRKFFPLVRNSLALRCGLKIHFLRKEPPGRIYQGGDIDNRLKTLFDALSIPKPEQVVDDPTIDDPIFCLLEDDALITRIDVETSRLLSRPNGSKHDVHLLIEVDVRGIA